MRLLIRYFFFDRFDGFLRPNRSVIRRGTYIFFHVQNMFLRRIPEVRHKIVNVGEVIHLKQHRNRQRENKHRSPRSHCIADHIEMLHSRKDKNYPDVTG